MRWTFTERTANRKLAKRLRARGKTLKHIAAHLGCGVSTVAWLLKSKPTHVGRHDDTIRRMRRAGHPIREIINATGMSASGIHEAIRRLDLPTRAPKRGSLPTWTAKAQRMRARGKTYAEIAAVVGVSRSRVGFILGKRSR